MDFVDLDRQFAPIQKDKDAELDWSLPLGRKYGNWLDWSELLEYRRIVLLAEASSGKTKEMEQQVIKLKQQGLCTFYVRIEDLVDRGLLKSLKSDDALSFDDWRSKGAGDAWFFLDSVDEARLNNKSFQTALRNLGNELGSGCLNRSFIVVSCRVSDWKGKSDRQLMQEELPFVLPKENLNRHDNDEILLAAIFDKETKKYHTSKQSKKFKFDELVVVQLVPLTHEQKLKMAEVAGIDGHMLLQAIHQSGLNAMEERPGDFIDLIDYWAEHGGISSLCQMTEDGVRRKLREENQHKKGQLSSERARDGSNRLAAALVLAKSFMLRAPGQEMDLTLSKGAIDPCEILSEWQPEEVNALLRTGLFAPSTYGRIRFHHRTTQEFLAACWLKSLLDHNCSISEIKRLLFAEPYGVKTAVPSLLSVAAWLSQWVPAVRQELIEREPVALIVLGDPKSLPLKDRESLLYSYAQLDAIGKLDYEYIDHRAAWMFSDALLASAIKQTWEINSKPAFRLHLLQFIEEGRIVECVHLARQAAGEQLQDDVRIAATRAMVACDDRTGLKNLARNLIAEPHRLSARLAPSLAELLYPNYLNTVGLHALIEFSQQANPFSSDGFASYLLTLHEQASSRSNKKRLAVGVAKLVLGSDDLNIPDEIDTRYSELCKGLENLAYAELALCEPGEVENGVLRLLMAVERVLNFYHNRDVLPELKIRVRKDKWLNRQLMWADAAAWRSRPETDHPLVHFCQIGPFFGRTLWGIDASDLDWLMQDARKMSSEDDRRIAFSAIWCALQGDEIATSYSHLNSLALADSVLRGDLAEFMKPSEPDMYAQRQIEAEVKEKKKIARQKNSWLDFSKELNKNPAILSQLDALTSWQGSLHSLYYLTTWLKKHASKEDKQGVLSYTFLAGVFSPDVIQHYATGMREIWRLCKPLRPSVSANNHKPKVPSHLILDALTLDSQNIGWATDLSAIDAKTAICHALIAGSIKCLWVDKIIQVRPTIALPEIIKQLRHEFASK